MKTWTRWLEYLRAWRWTPTDRVRQRALYSLRVKPDRIARLIQRQRLYFGRWGRWWWRTEQRWFTITQDQRKIGEQDD